MTHSFPTRRSADLPLPHMPMPSSSAKSLPIPSTRVSTLGPSPISVAPLIGAPSLPFSIRYRSEEHTPELQSLMRISYAVFCLNKKEKHIDNPISYHILLN